jgi:hypothetical protein
MNPVILADSRFLDGTPVATDTWGGYDVLNLRDLKTFTKWKAASPGQKFITVDCTTPRSANSIGVVGHNFGTAQAQVTVDSSPDGIAWTNRFTGFVPSSDRAILKTFPTASARWWRVGIDSAIDAPSMAVLLLGTRIVFPYPLDAPFIPAEEAIEAETNRSKAGHVLGTVVRFKPYRIRAKWSNLPRSFVEGTFLPFWEQYASNLHPFLWAWDLDRYPEDVRFVRVEEGYAYRPGVSLLGYYDSLELEMEGVKE